MGTKPKTHITDPTQDAPEGGILDAVRALRSAQASGRRTSIVPEMPPVPSLPTLERPSRDDKGPLTPPGSPRSDEWRPGTFQPRVALLVRH